MEENLSYWHSEIEALKQFEHRAKGIAYDEKAVSQLKTNCQSLGDEERTLVNKASEFKKKLEEIERETNEVLHLEGEYLHCDTSVDLKAIRDKLLEFTEKVESQKNDAIAAIEIFEKLEREEEQKISDLFGKDSPVSHYFREITGNIYKEVVYDIDAREIRVKLKDDSTLAASKLSGGAYDQLYLSIRLALGEKLMKGMKGFFILDDPLIKADSERLQRQIAMLKQISKLGWQILYFTAKDEVRDALKQDIDTGMVSYVELQSRFSK